MKHCPPPILAPFVAALATLTVATPADASGDIVVAAKETTAVVAPHDARLKLVNLPALEFALRAAFKCTGKPVSVTFSVSDTHVTLWQDELADLRATEATLIVPPRQLALAASNRFCIIGDPDTADELLVSGLATAHASLRCSDEDRDSVHFASSPLQVRLICERPHEDAQAPSEFSGAR